MGAAAALALGVHALMAGMIFFEVEWRHTPESSHSPVLDLSTLSVNVTIPQGQHTKVVAPSSGSGQVPVMIVQDEAHVGAGQSKGDEVLRLVRRQINAFWQPVEPGGMGRAVVLMTITRQGRVGSTKVIRMQGNESFGIFMKTFLADLGTLEFSVPDDGQDILVECEFSVGE